MGRKGRYCVLLTSSRAPTVFPNGVRFDADVRLPGHESRHAQCSRGSAAMQLSGMYWKVCFIAFCRPFNHTIILCNPLRKFHSATSLPAIYITKKEWRLYFFSQIPVPVQGHGHAGPEPAPILFLLEKSVMYLLHCRDSPPSDPIVGLSALRCCGGLPAAAVKPDLSKAKTVAHCFSLLKD